MVPVARAEGLARRLVAPERVEPLAALLVVQARAPRARRGVDLGLIAEHHAVAVIGAALAADHHPRVERRIGLGVELDDEVAVELVRDEPAVALADHRAADQLVADHLIGGVAAGAVPAGEAGLGHEVLPGRGGAAIRRRLSFRDGGEGGRRPCCQRQQRECANHRLSPRSWHGCPLAGRTGGNTLGARRRTWSGHMQGRCQTFCCNALPRRLDAPARRAEEQAVRGRRNGRVAMLRS